MRLLALAAVLGLIGSATIPAHASFPGRNGEILYAGEPCNESPDVPCGDNDGTQMFAVSPSRFTSRGVQMPGLVSSARWGPDGRVLVLPQSFDSYPSPQPAPGLFLMDAAQFPRRGLPEPATTRLLGPERFGPATWSPSGTQLVVESNWGLEVVQRDGGQPRQLLPKGNQPDWSSRNLIAFERGGNISAIRPDGSAARRLTLRGGKNGSWAPDGRRLVFERSRTLYVVRADGSGRRKLASRATTPVWSPDGRYVSFVRVAHEPECGSDGTGCDIAYLRIIRADGRGKSRAVNTFDGSHTPGPVRVERLLDWRPLP